MKEGLENKSITEIVDIKNRLSRGEKVTCVDEEGKPSFIC
jgi:hypothetical protein